MTNKISISIFIKGIVDVTGGAERAAVQLANALVGCGHFVEITTYEKRIGLPFYDLDPAVKLVNLHPEKKRFSLEQHAGKKKSKRTKKSNTLKYLKNMILSKSSVLRKLDRSIRYRKIVSAIDEAYSNKKPDVAIAFMNSMGIPLTISNALKGVPKIYSYRKTPDYEFQPEFRNTPLHLDGLNLRDCLDDYQSILIQIPTYSQYLPKSLVKKTKFIPNDIIPPLPAQGFLPLLERRKQILFVGRLIPSKRPMDLILAWKELANEFLDWTVSIYGDGELFDPLQEKIREHGLEHSIKLQGISKQIEEAYSQAQIFCFPSQFEGFPRALGEAMASGIACIARSDCEGSAHLLENCGILAERNTGVNSIVSNLKTLIQDPEQRNEIGEKCATQALQFTPDLVMDDWKNLISKLHEKNSVKGNT